MRFAIFLSFVCACQPQFCKDIELGTPLSDLPVSNFYDKPLPMYTSARSRLAGDCTLDDKTVTASKGMRDGAFAVANGEPSPTCYSKVPGDSYWCAVQAEAGRVTCVYEFCSD